MLAIIVLAAAVPSEPVSRPFLPVSPAPIIITPDNVDLNGAGRFEFEPDAAAFQANPPAGGDGVTVSVRLWLDPSGKPVSCDIGQSAIPKVAQTGCTQLLNSAKFHLFPGFALPMRRGFVDIQFSFFKDPPGGPVGEVMFANPYPGYINTEIRYPVNDTPADQMLTSGDGAFTLAGGITNMDYPSIAIRYGMESRSLTLLGIDRAGKVRSCRPAETPSPANTAFLDNYTCQVFLKRGRFQFHPTAPAFSGLRYRIQSLSWKMTK
jgi:hypothetical protein